MTRTALPDRRGNNTVKVTHAWANGKEQKLLVTFGVDDGGNVKEIFCADFKEGTDMHGLIVDACIVLSLLLQHGYSAQELRDKLAKNPQSLLATLVDAAIQIGEKK